MRSHSQVMLMNSRKLFIYFAITLFIGIDQSPTAFPLFGTNTGCGGRLTKPTGAIASPGYPQKYPRNTACVWTINVPDSKSIIELKFDSFMLENHPNCRYDYLLIRDGDSQSSPIIGKFCGDTVPNLIRSRSNRLWMRFYSDSAFTGNGFLASYAETKKVPRSLEGEKIPLTTKSGNCGGTLSGDSGTITSPKYPENYPNGVRCVWTIKNDNPQSTINLSFEEFKLEETQQCLFDYLLIEEMSAGNQRTIGKFCGRTISASSLSGQKLRISFITDESSNDKGFKLNWQRVGRSINFGGSERQECDGSKTGLLGFLRSNNYPENYADNENCEWKFSAPEESMKIQLRFADFELEPSSDCEYDYIEVYDGQTKVDPRLGKFCGRQIPDLIESTQKNMLVIFKTDKSDTRSGFEATWVSVFKHDDPRSVGVSRRARIPDASQGSCGGSFTSSTGSITTPKYPANYPPDSICTWKISADPKHQIKLTFASFNLEKHSNCKYDSVTIRDGVDSSSKVLGQSCGNKIPKEIISSGHAMWIQFVSDNSKQLTGFKAHWEFIRKSGQIACGTRFRRENGELSSPNYPRAPSNRDYCTWVIEVPYSMKIELTFKDINLRSSASCTYGYIQVFDGDTIQSPELGRFCKTFLPRPIMSTGNKLLLGFQPDGLAISRGFKADWKAIKEEKAAAQPRAHPVTPCGTTLTSESGNIILPKGVQTCLWLIKPASGKQITLSIAKANLIPNPNCDVEKLEVRNGFTSLAPLLLKICGSLQPRSVTSFTGVLRLEYRLLGNADKQDVHLFWTTKKERLQSAPFDKGSCGIIKVPFPEKFKNNRAVVASGMLPWMAALLSGSGTIYCGASILSPKWIITAAHCFRRYPFYAFRKIIVGELNLFKSDGTEQVLDIKLIHIHPGYNAITNENDIALVQLDTQITLNEKVNTICLPDKDTDIKPGTICTTAGWGTRRFLGKPSKPLVLARIPIVPTNVCNSTKSYAGHVKEKMICAGRSAGGLDTCQGDGGGPLTCEIRPGKNILVGISSWGSGCAYPNRYGVYTEVQKHLQWISSIFDS